MILSFQTPLMPEEINSILLILICLQHSIQSPSQELLDRCILNRTFQLNIRPTSSRSVVPNVGTCPTAGQFDFKGGHSRMSY